jgi:hypothetical protein
MSSIAKSISQAYPLENPSEKFDGVFLAETHLPVLARAAMQITRQWLFVLVPPPGTDGEDAAERFLEVYESLRRHVAHYLRFLGKDLPSPLPITNRTTFANAMRSLYFAIHESLWEQTVAFA